MKDYQNVSIQNGMSLHIVEDKATYGLSMARGEDESYEEFGLWQVFLKYRKRAGTIPVIECHYVLAENNEGAISQCGDLNVEYIETSANRIPFRVRGWGNHTF